MRYPCSQQTDLDELIGEEALVAGHFEFRYGPLAEAMRRNEVLVLENSACLSQLMRAKIQTLTDRLFIAETEERIPRGDKFRLIMG
ncbi:MAG: hypothetical protein EG825_11095 [Rhodocyclaceae bacterium]|nr:hypothetical protein [Rhodocyclaceae bacterium]